MYSIEGWTCGFKNCFVSLLHVMYFGFEPRFYHKQNIDDLNHETYNYCCHPQNIDDLNHGTYTITVAIHSNDGQTCGFQNCFMSLLQQSIFGFEPRYCHNQNIKDLNDRTCMFRVDVDASKIVFLAYSIYHIEDSNPDSIINKIYTI